MDTNTRFHDELRYGCVWEIPSAKCPLEHRPGDTRRSARQATIGTRISGNRRAAVTRQTGMRAPNRFRLSASRAWRQVLQMRQGRYVRNRQSYPLQA